MTENNPQNRRLGYARVSTYGQTLDAQLEQLRAEGCEDFSREGDGRASRPARAVEALERPRPRRRGDGYTDRPVSPLDLRPVRNRQADRGRGRAIPTTGGTMGRHRHQHRALDDC